MTTRDELVNVVSGHLHAGQRVDAARLICDVSEISRSLAESDEGALEACWSLLNFCLDHDHYEWAAQMLWNEALFTYKPRCTKLVWEEIRNSKALMLMGAASMSKSYSGGVWLLLDWIRDPHYTSVNLVGPSEDHLKDNLFSHLVRLHTQSTLPLPGQLGELFIGMDPRERYGAIRGVVIPLGKKPSGRLQGRKRVPRPTPQPNLGPKRSIRLFLEEFEKIPVGVFKDIDNVFSNLTADPDGFKIIGAFNPEDPAGQVAIRCEPVTGWNGFNPDTDEKWTSRRGWRVLRLDAARCENVVEGKELYVGLQTKEGFERIILNAGGKDTPGYWTQARGCFPVGGGVYSVLSELVVHRAKRNFMFAEEPQDCGAVDLALEGKDAAEFAKGKFGKAVGYREGPSLKFPKGREVLFRDKDRMPQFRWALQVEQIFQLPAADAVVMAEQVKREAVRLHVAPGWLMVDRTGNGAGVHDLLKSLWSEEVRGLNYSEAATERKILEEDTKNCLEEYGMVISELWFALKKWFEFNFIGMKEEVYSEELTQQLTGRRYKADKVSRVESKDSYKSRGNKSPNKADALTLLLHGVRLASGCVPSALDSITPESQVGVGATDRAPCPVLVDSTNEWHGIEDDEDAEDEMRGFLE